MYVENARDDTVILLLPYSDVEKPEHHPRFHPPISKPTSPSRLLLL
jgi:hypothetical protein